MYDVGLVGQLKWNAPFDLSDRWEYGIPGYATNSVETSDDEILKMFKDILGKYHPEGADSEMLWNTLVEAAKCGLTFCVGTYEYTALSGMQCDCFVKVFRPRRSMIEIPRRTEFDEESEDFRCMVQICGNILDSNKVIMKGQLADLKRLIEKRKVEIEILKMLPELYELGISIERTAAWNFQLKLPEDIMESSEWVCNETIYDGYFSWRSLYEVREIVGIVTALQMLGEMRDDIKALELEVEILLKEKSILIMSALNVTQSFPMTKMGTEKMKNYIANLEREEK